MFLYRGGGLRFLKIVDSTTFTLVHIKIYKTQAGAAPGFGLKARGSEKGERKEGRRTMILKLPLGSLNFIICNIF